MNKKERLIELMRHFSDGKPSKFAKYVGVAPSTISSWLSRNVLDYDLLFAKCEMLSAEWLLTGEGDMIKSDTNNIISSQLEPNEFLYNMLKDKDAKIEEMAIEIGKLKEQNRQLKQGKGAVIFNHENTLFRNTKEQKER